MLRCSVLLRFSISFMMSQFQLVLIPGGVQCNTQDPDCGSLSDPPSEAAQSSFVLDELPSIDSAITQLSRIYKEWRENLMGP